MSGPSRSAIQALYNSMLRTSSSFSSYNFRNYFMQRTERVFREIQNESDPTKVQTFYDDAVKELDVLKRAAIVNELYGGKKLVVENQSDVRLRSDN